VYADAIASLIDNDITETPLTIAVSAPWGGGKTSVAKMVRWRLAERTASRGRDRPVLACWFDAWLHNDAPHLGAALATAVARTANEARPVWSRLLNPVPSVMLGPQQRWRRRLLMAALAVAVAALVVVISPLSQPVGKLLEVDNLGDKGGVAGPLLTSALLLVLVARTVFRAAEDAAHFVDDPRSEAARGSMAQVKEQLGDLIKQARRSGRLVIYVDDLERCAPARALEVCEVANQLLSHEGVVTILVADMHTVAAAAEARHPSQDADGADAGRRFLEKIVQLQVALPPPHREHIRRLLRGDPPDHAFTQAPSMATTLRARNARVPQSVAESFAETIVRASDRLGPEVAGIALTTLTVLVTGGVLATRAGFAVATLITSPFLVLGAAHGFLSWRDRAARVEEKSIRRIIQLAVAEQLPHEQLERRVLDGREPRYQALALDVLESFRLDNTPQLRRVVNEVLKYPAALPRGAKRMLNHARLMTQIARDREIFGGAPRLTPEHLGEWIVLAERWPQIAQRVSAQPLVMTQLEDAHNEAAVAEILAAHGLPMPTAPDDLIALLHADPRLSEVVTRLVHFEPAAEDGSADA
jgi:hypothetical protein